MLFCRLLFDASGFLLFCINKVKKQKTRWEIAGRKQNSNLVISTADGKGKVVWHLTFHVADFY